MWLKRVILLFLVLNPISIISEVIDFNKPLPLWLANDSTPANSTVQMTGVPTNDQKIITTNAVPSHNSQMYSNSEESEAGGHNLESSEFNLVYFCLIFGILVCLVLVSFLGYAIRKALNKKKEGRQLNIEEQPQPQIGIASL